MSGKGDFITQLCVARMGGLIGDDADELVVLEAYGIEPDRFGRTFSGDGDFERKVSWVGLGSLERCNELIFLSLWRAKDFEWLRERRNSRPM